VTGSLSAELLALEPRPWAQLLRALRRMTDVPPPLRELLTLPTSALASGASRAELCGAVAADDPTLEALRSDAALPPEVRQALDPAPGPASGGGGQAAESAGNSRSDDRARAVRRQLEEERRRREGAEARAASAEARASEATARRAELLARIAELEDELARSRDAVGQASARTERRSATRIADLERDLAAERSAHAALRRDHDRAGTELVVLREALEELRARSAVSSAAAPAAPDPHAAGRPLTLPEELEPETTPAARWLLERATLLLVDGYNVAFALRAGRPLEEQRRWLVDRLRPLAARGGPTPVVVFDGDGAGSARRAPSGVEVRFTARGTLADDDIVFVVAATAEPVVVITDDAELRGRVRAEGGNVIGTVQFLGAIDA
jgi:predicted RNA-binding protein with PIN domain